MSIIVKEKCGFQCDHQQLVVINKDMIGISVPEVEQNKD